MKKLLTLAVTLGLAASTTACMDMDSFFSGLGDGLFDGEGFWDSFDSSNLEVQYAELIGDLGDVRDIAGVATDISGWVEDNYAAIDFTVDGPQGAAMMVVDIAGGLNHPALQPGADLSFSGYGYGADDLHVSVTGCSGDQPGDWDFDEPADEVEVEVDEDPTNPDVLLYTVTAHYDEAPGGMFSDARPAQTIVGSFVVPRPTPEGLAYGPLNLGPDPRRAAGADTRPVADPPGQPYPA